jgi:hypothetical protein
MNGNIAALAVFFAILSCTQPSPGHAQAAPATAAAPAPGGASNPPAHHIVVISSMPCKELLSAAADDRAAASMFYLGYMAAKLGVRNIDVADVEGIETTALGTCVKNPGQPAAAAFGRALRQSGK